MTHLITRYTIPYAEPRAALLHILAYAAPLADRLGLPLPQPVRNDGRLACSCDGCLVTMVRILCQVGVLDYRDPAVAEVLGLA